MSFDDQLAERLRRMLGHRSHVSERRMFGGICFLLYGNMLCGVHRDTWMFRVGKPQYHAALSRPGARPMDITGKPMLGFVFVDPGTCDQDGLLSWVELAEAFVRTLPQKAHKPTIASPAD